jgi:Lar family restriction alleviation protein
MAVRNDRLYPVRLIGCFFDLRPAHHWRMVLRSALAMSDTLKPCPCGSEDVEVEFDKIGNLDAYRIACYHCGMQARYETTLESAEERWNALERMSDL